MEVDDALLYLSMWLADSTLEMLHFNGMPIRHYTPTDLPALYAINQASTPGVGHEGSAEGLKRWIDLATCLVATDAGGAPLGFINLIEPGTLAYESANLRWFEAWQTEQGCDLLYVDRIAISEAARGQGLGRALIGHALDYFRKEKLAYAVIETLDSNPIGQTLYPATGFQEIARQVHYAQRL